MSDVQPVKIISIKAIQLLENLEPGDEVLFRRDEKLYGIKVDDLLPDPGPPPIWPQEYSVSLPKKTYADNWAYTTPVLTYTNQNWLVEAPVYVEVEYKPNPVVVDARDAQLTGITVDALSFVNALEVANVRTDYRFDYVDWASKPKEPKLRLKPQPPTYSPSHPLYQAYLIEYAADLKKWQAEENRYRHELATYPYRLQEWYAKHNPDDVVPDGTHMSATAQMRVMERSLPGARNASGASEGQTVDVAILTLAIQELSAQLLEAQATIRQLSEKVNLR